MPTVTLRPKVGARHFKRSNFRKALDPSSDAIEAAAETFTAFPGKQKSLNIVYERFFQGFAVKQADVLEVVYNLQPVVQFMIATVEHDFGEQFDTSLGAKGVHIFAPFTGTPFDWEDLPHPLARSLITSTMIEAAIQVFSITLEAVFPGPKPFAKDEIDRIAEWLTDPSEGFSLRADQVRTRHTDIVFDYELRASFYGGNATFYRDAEKATLVARGARTRQDGDLLLDAAVRFAQFITTEQTLPLTFSANAHAMLPSLEAREHFLAGLRPDPRVVSPGVIGHVQIEEGSEPMRVSIEPSFNDPQSLFFFWQTYLTQAADWPSAFESTIRVIKEATAIYGVTFLPLFE